MVKNMPSRHPAVELALGVNALATRMTHRLEQRLAAHGLGLSEYLVMRLLSLAPERTMRRVDVADGVGLTPSGVTRLLLPMEKTGVVARERNEKDARVSLVRLTDAGERLCRDADVSFREGAESFFAPLAPAQVDRLLGLTKVILPVAW